MANPILPIQAGGNLPNLDAEDDLHEKEQQDADMQAYADIFDLDENDVEQEVIELEDGSVVVNFQEKQGPQKDPEFYADRKSTRLNSSHSQQSRMPSSA